MRCETQAYWSLMSLRSISDSNLTVTCLVDRTEFVNKPNYVPVGVFDNLPHRGEKAYKYMNSVEADMKI